MLDAEHKLILSPASYRLLAGSKDALCDVLRGKFGCLMTLQGPRTQTSAPSLESPVLLYEKNVSGCKITAWKGDMVTQDADAVVNAANEDLRHVGGIAWALAEAGGPRVKQESSSYISKHGPLPTGSVAVTSGGDLPCKQIIHAVGPRWDFSDQAKCELLLEDAIKSVLLHVQSDRSVRSVAIPAISSGIFSFPLEKCAEIIVRTVGLFSHSAKCDHLREIRFVNNDDRTAHAMTRACEDVLGPGNYLGASMKAASRSLPSAPVPTSTHQVPSSAVSCKINGLNLHLQIGYIEDQSSTVIVNSISGDLNLSEGRISKAILQKAGTQLQKEINRFKTRQRSSVIATRGWGLPCEYVYHVILTSYSEPNAQSVLGEKIFDCLAQAQKHNSRSISFPALGSGVLGFPKQAVAEVMVQTVAQFAHEATRTLDVHFVIHPGDSDLFTTFRNVLQRMPGVFHVQAADPQEPEETCAVIRGPSAEDVLEAENWMKNVVMAPGATSIQNNRIVLFGKKEHNALAELSGVEITESLADGIFSLSVTGNLEDKVRAVLQVEKDLLRVQEEHLRTLEEELIQNAVRGSNVNGAPRDQIPDPITAESGSSAQGPLNPLTRVTAQQSPVRQTLRDSCPQFTEKKKEFERAGLQLLKMERIQNGRLAAVNQSKKGNRAASMSPTHTLYMRAPAECCTPICKVGFHRLYSCGAGSKYGAGIYFQRRLSDALEAEPAFRDPDGLIYIFQAEVTPGKFTKGRRPYALPPAVAPDERELYGSLVDSVSDPKTFVIFDRHRALPQYLFTCKQKGPPGSYI